MSKKEKSVQDSYKKFCERPSSTNEHLPVLKELAEQCVHITEFGVRCGVSTWAFLAAKPKKLISYDIVDCKIDLIIELSKKEGIDFEFKKQDVLTATIDETDLLFIDTLHTYDQILKELKLHADKVRKYIVFHDIITFGVKGEIKGTKGIVPAIKEFLKVHKEWQVKKRYDNNNGLLIIEKNN